MGTGRPPEIAPSFLGVSSAPPESSSRQRLAPRIPRLDVSRERGTARWVRQPFPFDRTRRLQRDFEHVRSASRPERYTEFAMSSSDRLKWAATIAGGVWVSQNRRPGSISSCSWFSAPSAQERKATRPATRRNRAQPAISHAARRTDPNSRFRASEPEAQADRRIDVDRPSGLKAVGEAVPDFRPHHTAIHVEFLGETEAIIDER